jgi:hypothetical protein
MQSIVKLIVIILKVVMLELTLAYYDTVKTLPYFFIEQTHHALFSKSCARKLSSFQIIKSQLWIIAGDFALS